VIRIREAWIGLGTFLGKISRPIILTILFFVIITPVAIVTRVFGRDVFCMSRKNASYWVSRNQEELALSFFKRQF